MSKTKEVNFHGDKNKHFYLGNKNLPRAEMEFEWSPEMMKELTKCKRNILHFAENYFYIVNLDRGKEKIALYKCQKRVLRSLRDNRSICLMASRQIGKTTLIKIISNILIPKTGEIYWNGKSIRKNINYYFKNLTLVMEANTSKNDMTVIENINFWKNLFLSPVKNNEIDALLEMLNIQNYKNILVKNRFCTYCYI